jgi:hypothetical protein
MPEEARFVLGGSYLYFLLLEPDPRWIIFPEMNIVSFDVSFGPVQRYKDKQTGLVLGAGAPGTIH